MFIQHPEYEKTLFLYINKYVVLSSCFDLTYECGSAGEMELKISIVKLLLLSLQVLLIIVFSTVNSSITIIMYFAI